MELFCITTALVIVIARLSLNRLEEVDREKGLPVKHADYTLWGAITSLFKKESSK